MVAQRQLDIIEIPVPKDAKHPPPPNENLPAHEFSWGLIAPKGSGKTTLLCNLLMFYAGHFNTIIIFSPTVKNDEKWDHIKKQKILVENKPLKKFIVKLKEEEENKRSEPSVVTQGGSVVGGKMQSQLSGLAQIVIDDPKDEHGNFDARIPEENFIHVYDETRLKTILDEQQNMVDLLKENGKTKHMANRLLLVFDDLVGSTLFSNTRRNTFKMLNTNHRHLTTSIMMVSQAFKEIPRTVRTQFSCLVLFEIYSETEIMSIYDEFPMGMKKKDWEETFRYCVKEDFGFLYYNIQREKSKRIMKNFDEILFHEPDNVKRRRGSSSSSYEEQEQQPTSKKSKSNKPHTSYFPS